MLLRGRGVTARLVHLGLRQVRDCEHEVLRKAWFRALAERGVGRFLGGLDPPRRYVDQRLVSERVRRAQLIAILAGETDSPGQLRARLRVFA